jgi:flagellar FliL protein
VWILAEEEKVAEEKKPKIPKPKMSIIIGIVLALLGIVLAGGISFFVAAKIAGDRQPVTVIVKREPGQLVKIGDPKDGVVVNIGGITGRYLKILMTLEVEPTKDETGKLSITPQDEMKINDSIIKFLRSQKIDAFVAERQDELKAAIKKDLNEALGADRVLAVYITNAVIQ